MLTRRFNVTLLPHTYTNRRTHTHTYEQHVSGLTQHVRYRCGITKQ